MSWGTELWDKYEDLCSHTNSGIDFLEKSVAEFIKERGRVEKLHAKNLRDLVKRFMPKGIGNPTNPKQTGTQGLTNNGVNSDSGPASIAMRAEADEEYTHLLAYKEVRHYLFSICWISTREYKFKGIQNRRIFYYEIDLKL